MANEGQQVVSLSPDSVVKLDGRKVRLGDLQPWQLRMVEEMWDVQSRYSKLTKFLDETEDLIVEATPYSVDPKAYAEQLQLQRQSMFAYLATLVNQVRLWDLSDITIQDEEK